MGHVYLVEEAQLKFRVLHKLVLVFKLSQSQELNLLFFSKVVTSFTIGILSCSS